MKKIILLIITILLFFSSVTNSFAEEGYVDRLFNFKSWIEEEKLNSITLKYVNFKSSKYNSIYNEFKNADSILRKEFIKKYRNWEYEYYQLNWIINNYTKFIFYTNMYFYYLKVNEGNSNYTELDTAIVESLDNMKTYYIRVKNLVRWN